MKAMKEGWLPDKAPKLITELITAHINRRIVELTLLSRSLEKLNLEHPARIAMGNSMVFAKCLPPGALAAVVSEPEFHYWCYISRCIRSRIENNEDVPPSDTPYLVGVQGYRECPILFHVLELNRFILSAAIMSSLTFYGDIPVHNGRVIIPSLGIVIDVEVNDPTVLIGFDGDDTPKLTVNNQFIDGFDLCVRASLEKDGGAVFGVLKVLPWIRMSSGAFVLNGIDPYIRHAWVTSYRNADGSHYGEVKLSEYESWRESLAQVVKILAECWPEMESDISMGLRTIVPIKSPLPSIHMSCSSDVMAYALLMSDDRPVVLAEAFIHEFGHNVLNSLIELAPVFKEPIRDSMDLYSPWRPDARHLSGVFHAVFVFERVCEFYQRYLSIHNDDEVRHRFIKMTIRNLIALDVIDSVSESLDSLGVQILELLRTRITMHSELLTSIDWKATKEELENHYLTWLIRNENINIKPLVSKTLFKLLMG